LNTAFNQVIPNNNFFNLQVQVIPFKQVKKRSLSSVGKSFEVMNDRGFARMELKQ